MPNYDSNKIGFKKVDKFNLFKFISKKGYFLKGFYSNKRFGNGIFWIIKFLIVVIGIKLIYDVNHRRRDNRYHIMSYEVPQTLNIKGISGDYVSRFISDHINDINSNVTTHNPLFGKFPLPNQEFQIEIVNNTDELTYSGVSYSKLVSFLANIFGSRKYISGDILYDSTENKIEITTRFSDNLNEYIYFNTNSLLLTDNINLLMYTTAEKIYSELNPLHYALYIYNCKDWLRCINFLDSYLSRNQGSTNMMYAYWLKGACLQTLRKYEESNISYKQSLKYNDKEFYNYINIALNYIDLNEFDSAKRYINTIEDNKFYEKNIAGLYTLKGIYYSSMNIHDSAIHFYRLCSENENSSFAVYENIAISFADMNNFDSASYYLDLYRKMSRYEEAYLPNALGHFTTQQELNNLIQTKRNLIGNYKYGQYVLGDFYYNLGKMDSAVYYLNKAIYLDSTFYEAFILKAQIHSINDDFTTANELFSIAYSLTKTSQRLFLFWTENFIYQSDFINAFYKNKILGNLNYSSGVISTTGDIFAIKNDYLKSEYYYKLSEFYCTTNINNLTKLVRLNLNKHKYNETIEYCNKILSLDSNDLFSLSAMGKCAIEMKDFKQTDNISNKLNKLNANYPAALLMAEKEKSLSNFDKACKYYLKVFEYNNNDTASLKYLIDYYSRIDKIKSLPFLLKLAKMYPSNAYGNYCIGECYVLKKLYTKAIEYFRRSLIQEPSCQTAKYWGYCLLKLNKNPYTDAELISRVGNISNCDFDNYINN